MLEIRPRIGGGSRIRTGDILLAKQTLYQLSYTPTEVILSAALAACAFIAFGSAVTPPDQPVLVDTSASAGSVVESSVSATAYPPTKAFDGAWNTISSDRWLAYINPNKNDYTGGLTGETPAYVTYKFNTATRVSVLRIRIPSDKDYACSDRAPKAWTFLGSNDGSAWTTLDTRSGITWASGTTTKTFTFENHKLRYCPYLFLQALWQVSFAGFHRLKG